MTKAKKRSRRGRRYFIISHLYTTAKYYLCCSVSKIRPFVQEIIDKRSVEIADYMEKVENLENQNDKN